ncbi:MAG: T9SS type A sorting domain-containing protein [Saprospiraceae bacterium]|nr:T9SS type A sorting domain-containing protein [Saprospiraceae bacterium]
MKKLLSPLILFCLLCWQLMHAQAPNEMILYADANFGGQSVTVTVGTYPNISSLGFPNNTASSIKVGSDVVAVLHSCVDFGGGYSNGFRAYNATDADFSNDFWPQGQNCGGPTANNNINALWVMNKNCVPGPDEVSFFDNPNFVGGCVTVPVGSYISPTLAGMPNDWAGSVKVGSNVSVKIWVADFQGANNTYGPGTSITALGIGTNTVSSLVVDGCPNDPNKIEPGICGCGVPETNSDNDNLPNCIDPDDDNDNISDVNETACGSNPLNANSTCEVCDGADNDLDGTIDEGFLNTDGDEAADCVDADDDNDGVADGNDADQLDKFVCQDADGDGCDDCSSGYVNPANDGLDTDGDGLCNTGDPDDDNDGISDACDTAPLISNYVFNGTGPNFPPQWTCSNNNNVKVKICHNGNTLCVSSNAINSHLSHGDYLGECTCAGQQAVVPPSNSDVKIGQYEALELELFPNPTSGNVNVHLHGLEDEAMLKIYDQLGRVVWSQQLEDETHAIQLDLQNGIYLVQVKSGEATLTEQLVISRR